MERDDRLKFLKLLYDATPGLLRIEIEESAISLGEEVAKKYGYPVIVEHHLRMKTPTQIKYKTLEMATIDPFIERALVKKYKELMDYLKKQSK